MSPKIEDHQGLKIKKPMVKYSSSGIRMPKEGENFLQEDNSIVMVVGRIIEREVRTCAAERGSKEA